MADSKKQGFVLINMKIDKSDANYVDNCVRKRNDEGPPVRASRSSFIRDLIRIAKGEGYE